MGQNGIDTTIVAFAAVNLPARLSPFNKIFHGLEVVTKIHHRHLDLVHRILVSPSMLCLSCLGWKFLTD